MTAEQKFNELTETMRPQDSHGHGTGLRFETVQIGSEKVARLPSPHSAEIAYRVRELETGWMWVMTVDGVGVGTGMANDHVTARAAALSAAANFSFHDLLISGKSAREGEALRIEAGQHGYLPSELEMDIGSGNHEARDTQS